MSFYLLALQALPNGDETDVRVDVRGTRELWDIFVVQIEKIRFACRDLVEIWLTPSWVLAYENQGAEAPKSVQAFKKVRLFMTEN